MNRPDLPRNINLASWFVDQPAEKYADRIAILEEDRSLTYRALQSLVNRAGNSLRRLGCAPGDRVVIRLPDGVAFAAAFFGALKIGAIPVPISPLGKISEYISCMNDSGARYAITSDLDSASAGAPRRSDVQVITLDEETGTITRTPWTQAFSESSPALDPVPADGRSPALFLYTSGSTGKPKAAVHAHHSLMHANYNVGQGVFQIGQEDRMLSLTRLFFSLGLACGLYFPLFAGGSTVLNSEPNDPRTVASLINKYRPTILVAVPSILAALEKAARNWLEIDWSSLRFIATGGEPLPPGLFERFKSGIGVEILEGLGSTEMINNILSNRPGEGRSGTCGREVPGVEIELRDENGAPVEDGKIGTLYVKSPTALLEYWNKPAETARIRAGEWITLGDKMYRDPDGFFHFCGRNDDMLKIAGEWVVPGVVEAVILKHPDVDYAIVTAREDKQGIKRLVAYIAPKGSREVTAGDLTRFVSERVQPYMVPSIFVVLAELPRTPTGKVDRQLLPRPEWPEPSN